MFGFYFRHVEIYTSPHMKFVFSVKNCDRMQKGYMGFNLMQVLILGIQCYTLIFTFANVSYRTCRIAKKFKVV